MNMPGMENAAATLDTTALALRIVLLLATAVVAGIGLLRPLIGTTSTRTVSVAIVLAAVAGVADLLSIPVVDASVAFTVVQLLLSSAIPFLIKRSGTTAACAGLLLTGLLIAESSPGHTGLSFLADLVFTFAAVVWLGMAVYAVTVPRARWAAESRARTLAVGAAGLLALAGIGQLADSGVAFDRRVYESGYGLALLLAAVAAVLVFVVATWVRRSPQRVYRIGVVGVVLGFGVWTASTAFSAPGPLPVPGVPEMTTVSLADKQLPVLITPQRPGRNLVHFAGDVPVSVAVNGAPAVRSGARPGAEGSWAEVELPAGRSSLQVSRGAQRAEVDLDAGSAAGPASASGVDGPECASAALGTLAAGQRTVLAHCPSDALDPGDGAALRRTVEFLVAHHAPALTLAGDDSPRSRQAEAVIRAAAQGKLPLTTAAVTSPAPQGALMVTSGWARTSEQLRSALGAQHRGGYGFGFYLAPWLLNAPILNSVPSSSLPLRFDPRVPDSLQFSVTVENMFGGENPSTSGYYAWMAARNQTVDSGVQIYAAAQVDAMPMDMPDMGGTPYPGQWVPNGTIVPVSGLLEEK